MRALLSDSIFICQAKSTELPPVGTLRYSGSRCPAWLSPKPAVIEIFALECRVANSMSGEYVTLATAVIAFSASYDSLARCGFRASRLID